MLLRDIRRTKALEEQVVCFIDDNSNKWNRDVDGVPVVGGRNEIIPSVRSLNVDKIYVAIRLQVPHFEAKK